MQECKRTQVVATQMQHTQLINRRFISYSADMMGRKPDEPQPLKLAEVQEVAKAKGKTPAQVLVNV